MRSRFGTWLQTGSAVVAEVIGRSAMDFLILDMQHGFGGFESAVHALQILETLDPMVLVRIGVDEAASIPRYLDAGAQGIVLASVERLEQVHATAALMRYQPAGRRSYGGQRLGMRRAPDDVASVKAELHVMVETAGAVDALESIASSNVIDGLFVGPTDLALALGDRPDQAPASDVWTSATRRVVELCANHNLAAGIAVADAESARTYAAAGFDLVVVSSDMGMLRRGAELVAQCRHGANGPSVASVETRTYT